MDSIAIEDCLKYIPNRFELVLIATHRARQLFQGKPSYINNTKDKPIVVALQEIATGLITRDALLKI